MQKKFLKKVGIRSICVRSVTFVTEWMNGWSRPDRMKENRGSRIVMGKVEESIFYRILFSVFNIKSPVCVPAWDSWLHCDY